MDDETLKQAEALKAVLDSAETAERLLAALGATESDGKRADVPAMSPELVRAVVDLVRALETLTDAQREALKGAAVLSESRLKAVANLIETLERQTPRKPSG